MNPAALAAYFAAHKTAILGTAAAGVAGVALYRKKTGATSTTAGATVPGTIPAAAVVQATPGTAYDSSAYDVYSALQSELAPILQQQATQTGGTTGTGVTTAPKPVASTLLAPSGSHNYVRFADGQIDQVQSDGSLLWLNPSEAAKAFGKGGWAGKVDQLTVKAPAGVFTTGKNLVGKNTPAKATS